MINQRSHLFPGAIFLGPVIGPIVGGFVIKSHLSWRWTAWITGIITLFFLISGLFCLSESYTPLILQRRAKRLRYEKRQWRIHSKLDEKEYTAKEIANNYLLRPTSRCTSCTRINLLASVIDEVRNAFL